MSAAIEAPDWVNDTPPEARYDLTMYVDRGDGQEINITREEFIELKRHLAAVRGYVPGGSEGVKDLLDDLVKELGQDPSSTIIADKQQVAFHLVVAREIYRRCPEAVVGPEELFGGILRRLSEEEVPRGLGK